MKAIVLNQMMYWSKRVYDAAQMKAEEKTRFTTNAECVPVHGWVYKKSEELSRETLMDVGPKVMRDHLKYLVVNGWLFERRNPRDKMDRTLQ